ncbi:hypothetical protein [Variovorax boronicumulans]|uniref:hypothetical protein n=1 Tax=Variovorax boronicumulans TaxID=436515 RepID=UPI00277DBDDD|nr:hypothetical protein [Variovorax boronicumulans]MDQ0044341.1 hypothetical protein [Variovorax boronicumulans]
MTILHESLRKPDGKADGLALAFYPIDYKELGPCWPATLQERNEFAPRVCCSNGIAVLVEISTGYTRPMKSFSSTLKIDRCARTMYRTRQEARAGSLSTRSKHSTPVQRALKTDGLSTIQSMQKTGLKPGGWGTTGLLSHMTVCAMGARPPEIGRVNGS